MHHSDMSSVNSHPNHFHYQLFPSAFKIAECPTYYCWNLIRGAESLWDQKTSNGWEQFTNRTIALLRGTGGYLGGIVALPITLCAAPFTLLVDVIVGIAECIFCAYNGLGKEDLLMIAHRKFIISPCQHLAFALGALGALGAALLLTLPLGPWVGAKRALLLWTWGYAWGQIAVGKLPEGYNHRSFNIFINGGSSEGGMEGTWLDSDISFFKKSQSNTSSLSPPGWNDFIRDPILSLNRIDDANLEAEYINFKKRLCQGNSPSALFDLPSNFNEEMLTSKYRKLSFLIHPDRNCPRQKEATALFTVLNEAYVRLKSSI